MAKVTCTAVLVSVEERPYDGKTYRNANIMFPEDGSTLRLQVENNPPELGARLKNMPQLSHGTVTLSFGAYKGDTVVKVSGFEPKK